MLPTLGGAGPGLRSNGMAVRQANLAWETLLDLSATRPGPLHMRLAAAIRAAVRDGRLPVGAALPPSRMLAADLGVSRWTVTEAYSQLITEGYLTGKTGSATRVTWSPRPGDEPRAEPARKPPAQAAKPASAAGFDLSSYHPDLRAFPRRRWVEAIRAAAETAPFDRLSYSEPGGLPELRAVLAEHLNRSRGASAEPDTICVVMGAGQGMSRLCRALLADGHTAIGMENPGSPRLWQAAQEAGLELVSLPVDGDGLVVEALDRHPGPGAYDRHLRASRQRYRVRRNVLVDALQRHLPGYRVRGAEAGVQLLLELPPGTHLPAILQAAARRGIELCNLYEMQLQPEPVEPGLLVGYGNIKDTAIDEAVAALAEVIRASG